jgi:branched-chain amino acid transport system ATP-binding protein
MTAVLEIIGLQKSFGGLVVTNEVRLSLEAGARHALIGPNGAGKTTVVGLLSGTIKPEAGRILLAHRDITHSAPQDRVKAGLVRTFQVNNLFFGLTVLQNVLLALGEHCGASRNFWRPVKARRDLVERAHRVLGTVGIAIYGDRRIADLPYGPQRLVEFAIALSLEPKVLLLDEPMAGVPAADAARLLAAIDQLPADVAVLMIEHDMRVVRRFARTVTVLVNGRVLASGTPEEVMSNAEVHRVYLGKGECAATDSRHA